MNPTKHLFMLCRELSRSALTALPEGYHVRACRPGELDLWMAMQFDTTDDAAQYRGFMQSFFDRVYAPRAHLFFERCLFACDAHDRPVATGFTWTITAGITTFHWLKVERTSEGNGLGRAILSHAMQRLDAPEYPVLLHTHPTSQRAIKLYSDVGFQLLRDPRIGSRHNDLESCLPMLRETMPPRAFGSLVLTDAPRDLLDRLHSEIEPEF
jgi:ribosomal protein S18 acetylase RimI-like enzyme